MKINRINNSVNFGRVIQIKQQQKDNTQKNKISSDIFDVVKVLNGYETIKYNKEESLKIRGFFKEILGDYNGKKGISAINVNGNTYLLSGKDMKEIEELQNKKDKLTAKKKKSKTVTAIDIKKSYIDLCKTINKKSENGFFQKPETVLEFSFSQKNFENFENKIDTFVYTTIEQTNSEVLDGFVITQEHPDYKSEDKGKFLNISYEEKTLKL